MTRDIDAAKCLQHLARCNVPLNYHHLVKLCVISEADATAMDHYLHRCSLRNLPQSTHTHLTNKDINGPMSADVNKGTRSVTQEATNLSYLQA